MTRLQRKYWEIVAVLGCLLVVVSIFQDDAFIARAAFLPVAAYFIFNWETIRSLESVGPNIIEVFNESKAIKYWAVSCVVSEIVVAYFFLFSGKDLGTYLTGFISFSLAFLIPGLPALIASQIELYKRLGSVDF